MKKYIKYYDETAKRYKRVSVNANTTIGVCLMAEGMRVKFFNKRTNEIRFTMKLLVEDKELERLCRNLIDTNLSSTVEMLVLQMVTKNFTAFLNSGQRSLPANKVGLYWYFVFVLFLLMVQCEQGNDIQKLADELRKING